MVRQAPVICAPVICVMVPPIYLGAWSMALMLWLPFELLLLLCVSFPTDFPSPTHVYIYKNIVSVFLQVLGIDGNAFPSDVSMAVVMHPSLD